MIRLRALARDLLPVRPEERSLALFLYALLTLMVLSDWVGKVGADSLFVKRLGVQYIPAMYIVTPLAMLLTSALLFAVVDRVRRRTLLFGYLSLVLVLSVAIQLALPLGGLVLPIAYVFAHGVKETIYLLFWVYAGNLYDSEQSARLFPLFAGAVLVGKILGGVVAAALADTVHSENFIGAQAIGFFVCLILIVIYRDRLPEGRGRRAPEPHRPIGLVAGLRDTVDGYRAVASDRLLRVFGIGIFFWYFLMQTGSYLYLVGLDASSVAATAQRSEDAFSQLYASVYTSSSIAALVIQTFLTPVLLRRIGVIGVLFVFPLWYLASYTGAYIAFGLLTAIAIQLGERIVVPAIHRPATELVFSQVSARIRPRARTFLSGGVNALGNIGAAVILLAASALSLGASAILALASVLSLVFLANAVALRNALGARLAANLASPDQDLRRNASQMLHTDGHAVPAAALQAILEEPALDVEESVRRVLVRRGIVEATAE